MLYVAAQAPSERFWLAGRYDGNRIIVYFDAVQFNGTVSPTAKRIVEPVAGGFFAPVKLQPDYDGNFSPTTKDSNTSVETTVYSRVGEQR